MTNRAHVAFIRAGVAATAAFAIALQLLDFGVFERRFSLLDMSTHRSLFGVVSLAALATAIVSAASLARTGRSRAGFFGTLAGLLGVLLALRIAHPPNVLLWSLPVLAPTLVLLAAESRSTWNPAIRDGCVVLVLAFAMYAINNGIGAHCACDETSWRYQIRSVLQHAGELTGWMLVAAGLAHSAIGGEIS